MAEHWTEEELSDLRRWHKNMPNWRIASRLGKSEDAVKKMASRLKMRKSKRYLKSMGLRK